MHEQPKLAIFSGTLMQVFSHADNFPLLQTSKLQLCFSLIAALPTDYNTQRARSHSCVDSNHRRSSQCNVARAVSSTCGKHLRPPKPKPHNRWRPNSAHRTRHQFARTLTHAVLGFDHRQCGDLVTSFGKLFIVTCTDHHR
jgi:hypothetical protein